MICSTVGKVGLGLRAIEVVGIGEIGAEVVSLITPRVVGTAPEQAASNIMSTHRLNCVEYFRLTCHLSRGPINSPDASHSVILWVNSDC